MYRLAAAGLVIQGLPLNGVSPVLSTAGGGCYDAVRLASAAILVIDFEPTASKQLSESRSAVESCRAKGPAAAPNLKAAMKWRKLVQMKWLGELSGAFGMVLARPGSRFGPLGASTMLLSHAAFWLLGAASCRTGSTGLSDPAPPALAATILRADLVLAALAAGAALLPGRALRLMSASTFGAGIIGVCAEKLAGKMKRQSAKMAMTAENSGVEVSPSAPLSHEDERPLPPMSLAVSSLRAVFNQIDQDGSGSLDSAEVTAALLALGVEPQPMEVTKLFYAADANGDGVIDYGEFEALYASARRELKQRSPVKGLSGETEQPVDEITRLRQILLGL